MRIIAADSGAAILKEFQPAVLIASAAVLVEEPFREASEALTRAVFLPVESREEIVHEISLCRELLMKHRADVVHVDISLGGTDLSTATFEEVEKLIPGRVRKELKSSLEILLQQAEGIRQTYRIPVLAIGKDSMPIRIAELTAGAHAVLYMIERASEERRAYTVGLPHACELRLHEGGLCLTSLLPAERNVRGLAPCPADKLRRVSITQLNNPLVRGFKAVLIKSV